MSAVRNRQDPPNMTSIDDLQKRYINLDRTSGLVTQELIDWVADFNRYLKVQNSARNPRVAVNDK